MYFCSSPSRMKLDGLIELNTQTTQGWPVANHYLLQSLKLGRKILSVRDLFVFVGMDGIKYLI